MKLEIYPETCCEYCGNTIHNHFDCPACGEENAPTSVYGEIWEAMQDPGKVELRCEECGATFVAEKQEGFWDDWEWTMKEFGTAIMELHCYGEVSEEEYPVVSVSEGVITLETDEDPDKYYKFDLKTGRCLNDNAAFGAKRILKFGG